MFTATEMNRISNNNFELDETMLDCMKEIENEILFNAFNGKKCVRIDVFEDEWDSKEVRNMIQFLRNRGYDVKLANDEMLIRW